MFANPFTPVFGGKPEFFFGRQDILKRFDRAMIDYGSDDRALFFTGTRGCGKTALLEQLSKRAAAKGFKAVDLSSENTVEILVRSLIRHGEETRTLSPEAGVSVFGIGASISAGSASKTTRYTAADLQLVFLDACRKLPGGLFVSIDEVQKVSEGDLTAICDAFQMASRKGRNVMLAVAGLPYAHAQIIQFQGCTYLRRAAHEEIGLLSRVETQEAFESAFSRIKGIGLQEQALNALVNASFGHPYLMQLLGYHLVLSCNELAKGDAGNLTAQDVECVVPVAYDSYERRALVSMMDELTNAERGYLAAMSRAMGEQPMVKTSAVAGELGKEQTSLGKVREALLRLGLVAVPQRGSIMFTVPLMRQFVLKKPKVDRNVARALDWGV